MAYKNHIIASHQEDCTSSVSEIHECHALPDMHGNAPVNTPKGKDPRNHPTQSPKHSSPSKPPSQARSRRRIPNDSVSKGKRPRSSSQSSSSVPTADSDFTEYDFPKVDGAYVHIEDQSSKRTKLGDRESPRLGVPSISGISSGPTPLFALASCSMPDLRAPVPPPRSRRNSESSASSFWPAPLMAQVPTIGRASDPSHITSASASTPGVMTLDLPPAAATLSCLRNIDFSLPISEEFGDMLSWPNEIEGIDVAAFDSSIFDPSFLRIDALDDYSLCEGIGNGIDFRQYHRDWSALQPSRDTKLLSPSSLNAASVQVSQGVSEFDFPQWTAPLSPVSSLGLCLELTNPSDSSPGPLRTNCSRAQATKESCVRFPDYFASDVNHNPPFQYN